jgi:nucleotide-binding universal stress UspA family protein
MKRILVPTDFSEASQIAIGHAVEVADAMGADLLLLHVIDQESRASAQLLGIREAFTMTIDPTGNAFKYEVPRESDNQAACEEVECKLAALLPPLESDRLRTLVGVGGVADEIIRVAIEERVGLIIMGIQGRKGWRHMRLDGVSEKVIQKSLIPVMTLWVPRHVTSHRGRAPNLALAD